MTALWSAMINAAILSAMLTAGVGIALRVTPRRALNAATRYAIWWIVLLATVALPVSYVRWSEQAAEPVYTHAAPLTEPEPVVPIAAPTAVPRVTLPLEIPASEWLGPILFAWIATALLLLLRVALSYAALYRRTARAADALPELRARLCANRPRIRIALSEEIDIPMAVGPFRPAILIPTGLFASMTESDLDQIGLHEATHLARLDDYTLFFQRIVEALFALHPVVRWITRQLDLEREIACDDAVARSVDTARSYADCLTRMVASCGGVRPPLAAANVADSRSHLSRRVELLLRENRMGPPRLLLRRFVPAAVALVFAVGILAKTPLLLAFAIPQITNSVAAPLRTEVRPTVPAQEPLIIAQTTRPNPPPPLVPQPPPPPPPVPQLPLYRLGPSDVLGVTVSGQENITGTYTIGPDGRVSMPLIGEFSAVGLTIPELRDFIIQKLSAYFNDPVVNVQLLRNNSRHYRVTGGVARPGAYPLLKETRILDALAASGGLDALADPDKIVLLRGYREPDPATAPLVMSQVRPYPMTWLTFAEQFPFNYDETVKGIHPDQNVSLQDGDILFVPVD